MFLTIITLLAILASLAYVYVKNHFAFFEKNGIPHEKPLLLLGNMKGIGRTIHFRDLIGRVYTRFKGQAPIAGLFFFFRRVALVMDLDLAKDILMKDFKDFHDRGTYINVKDDPLTGHLVSLEGQQWKAMRTKLTPVFTSAKMRYMFPTIVQVAEVLVQVYDDLSKSDPELKVDIKELNARYTTDVIGNCAFGLECNSLKDPNAEFRRKGRDFFEKPRVSKLTRAFITSNPKLARRLGIKYFRDDISAFFLNCVKQTIEYRVANNVKRKDFMDLMISLKAKDESSDKFNNNKGIDLSQGLTLEQIAAQAFVFFIAGFNSSSTTITFCLYELAKNIEIQEILRAEILEVLQKHNNELSYEAMQEMAYLEQVLCETLRMYPVIANILRKANNNYKVLDTNFVIEKGMMVLVPTYTIHHDPDIYPNPEDFNPDRFTREAIEQRHRYSYLPFGEGPRNCIGIPFAHMQTKVALIYLLRKFKFSRSSQTEDPIELSKNSPDLMPKNPLFLTVETLR